MSENLLRKDVTFTWELGTPGRPEQPGSPARPEYTVWESVTQCGFVLEGATYGWVTPDDGEPELRLISTPPEGARYVFKCITVEVQVTYPASDGTPSTPAIAGSADTLVTGYNLGWNAGAISRLWLASDGYMEWDHLNAVGSVVGFGRPGEGQGYASMTHAIMVESLVAKVMEQGVVMATIGAVAAGDTFRISRNGGVVRYWQNGTEVYESDVHSGGDVWMDVSLFSGGDAIENPVLGGINPEAGTLGSADISLPALACVGGVAYRQGLAIMPAMTCSGSVGNRGDVSMPALVCIGGKAYAQSAAVMPAMTVTAEAGFVIPSYALGIAALPALQCMGIGLQGSVGTGAAVMPGMLALGSRRVGGARYAAGTPVMPPMFVLSDNYEGPYLAVIPAVMAVDASLTTIGRTLVIMSEALGLAAVVSVTVTMTAQMAENLVLAEEMTAQAVLRALMQEGLVLAESGDSATGHYEVWVADLESGASTQYDGYEFTSYGRIGDSYYGCNESGIYLLEGADDDGSAIRAAIHFGRTDFGTMQRKRVPHVYAQASSDGALVIRVQADNGEAYVYEAVHTDTEQRAVRFDTGKGLQGTFISLELLNVDGSSLELDGIELVPTALNRRI